MLTGKKEARGQLKATRMKFAWPKCMSRGTTVVNFKPVKHLFIMNVLKFDVTCAYTYRTLEPWVEGPYMMEKIDFPLIEMFGSPCGMKLVSNGWVSLRKLAKATKVFHPSSKFRVTKIAF